jgi:hypothetical protein
VPYSLGRDGKTKNNNGYGNGAESGPPPDDSGDHNPQLTSWNAGPPRRPLIYAPDARGEAHASPFFWRPYRSTIECPPSALTIPTAYGHV